MKFTIQSADLVDAVTRRLKGMAFPMVVEVKPVIEGKSRSANALYRIWLRAMAEKFSNSKHQFTEDEMHDLMRHKFLGYEDKMIGKTVIKDQLKSTKDSDSHEFMVYMEQVDHWAVDNGCLLPRPEDNQYTEWSNHGHS